MQTLGHYFIKSPNGTYALVSHKSLKTVIIETGKLKSGEYIISPNNYEYYKKGNTSDLFIKGNYTYISRYLAAIDEYSSQRTNEFTYNYMKNEIAAKDFDIALIGCGAYGMPLAAYVKSLVHDFFSMILDW